MSRATSSRADRDAPQAGVSDTRCREVLDFVGLGSVAGRGEDGGAGTAEPHLEGVAR